MASSSLSYMIVALIGTTTSRALGTECVSHATLKCINDASTFWPRCDPSQSKVDNFPTSNGRTRQDYGHFCTSAWVDALNAMLSHSTVNKCGDMDAQIKLLAQVAVETGYFSTLFQPADGGAGLVHMIPNNWPINAQDMQDLFGGDYVQQQAAMGADFFRQPNEGWLSVAAWFKRTNRVIPGCDKDLFDESFSTQTQCIFGQVNDRSEAFDIVSRCFNEQPSTTSRPDDGSCSGAPCADATLCRSQWGHCGSSPQHCNAASTWKATGCDSSTTSTTTTTTTATTTSIDEITTTTTTAIDITTTTTTAIDEITTTTTTTTEPSECTDAQLPVAWSGGGVHTCSTYQQHGGSAYCAHDAIKVACCFCAERRLQQQTLSSSQFRFQVLV